MREKLTFKFDEKIFCYTVIALAVVTRLRYADIAMERDEGEYAYAGWQILRGGLPYKDFYNMKFPGVYYFYALIFQIFGNSMIAVRLVVMLLNFASAFFIFKIGDAWISRKGAWVASGFFILLSLSCQAQGFISNCEHFVVFFAMSGLFFLVRKQYFLSGLLLGISFLMKQQGMFFAAFAGFYTLFYNFSAQPLLQRVKNSVSLTLAFFIPLSILLVFLIKKGLFESFYFFCFEYAAAYSNLTSPFEYIGNFKDICQDNPIFWLFLLISALLFIIGIIRKRSLYDGMTQKSGLFMLFWLFSFASVCPGWYFRPHYFQYLFPASALLLAYGYVYFSINFKLKNITISNVRLLGFALFVAMGIQIGYFFIFTPDRLSKYIYRGCYFSEVKELSLSLKETTADSTRIFVFGNEPQICFYAQRQNVSNFLYRYPLTEKHKFVKKFTEEYITKIEAEKPEIVVWLDHDKTTDNLESFAHLRSWIGNFLKDYNLKYTVPSNNVSERDVIRLNNRPFAFVFERRK